MRTLLLVLCIGISLDLFAQNKELSTLVDNYYEEYLKEIEPVAATFVGDNRYNDLLYINFTDSRREKSRQFAQKYLAQLKKINRESLSAADKIEYDVAKYTLETSLDGLSQKTNLMPFTQFDGLQNTLPLLGSGNGAQPFKTVKDYDNWLRRASVFPAWADSAIVYFRKGVAEKIVLPKALVGKMVTQLAALTVTDPTKSIFYGPVKNMPADFPEADKQRLTQAYTNLISAQLMPAYQKLQDFLKNEYIQSARTTSGIGALPGGISMYRSAIRNYTTTNISPDEVFELGLKEVARIRKEMEEVKVQVGFSGDLKSFFDDMRTNPKLYPYKTPEEIIAYYNSILPKIQPKLKTMFNHVPKTPFEVRQTEAFRAATAAAQYFSGSLETGRPGIFYVPIVDATKTQARESLFLHEAIPGHHYQIALQNENKGLSKVRRYNGNSAYAEGWGLYAESLGKELGMYTDPYQYMLALGDEMHRAIRLVVDAGMHAKGWTREQAIQYALDNEPIEEQRAISETERYMARPGQALAYKIGELKIKGMREKYSKQLGSAFNLASFHDAILMDGSLPLDVLEMKMEAWAKSVKSGAQQ